MKDKDYEWDVTISFRVWAKDEDKAKEKIEDEIGWMDENIIKKQIWFKTSKED